MSLVFKGTAKLANLGGNEDNIQLEPLLLNMNFDKSTGMNDLFRESRQNKMKRKKGRKRKENRLVNFHYDISQLQKSFRRFVRFVVGVVASLGKNKYIYLGLSNICN